MPVHRYVAFVAQGGSRPTCTSITSVETWAVKDKGHMGSWLINHLRTQYALEQTRTKRYLGSFLALARIDTMWGCGFSIILPRKRGMLGTTPDPTEYNKPSSQHFMVNRFART
jgi:hypothetical protein